MSLVGIGGEWQDTFNQVQQYHANAADTADAIRGEITATLNTIAASIAAPVTVPTWGTLTGGTLLPNGWGDAWTAPSPVAVPTVTGPAAIAFGTIAAPAAMTAQTAPVWSDTLPTEPGDAPAVTALTVAELETLTLPTFAVTVPAEDIGTLVAPFEFTDESYTGRMDGRVEATLHRVLDGEPVIGSDVFRGLRDQAAAGLAAAYADELIGAGTACGMLGELPGEALIARVDAATTKYRKGLQAADLTFALKQAETWREDFWKGIDAAHAYEGLWSALHVQEIGRRLQAATAAVQAAATVHNANVARYNLLLQRLTAEIAVSAEHRARLLATIEDHKERLAHRASDLQEADIRLRRWLGLWEGYKAAAGASATVFAEKVRVFTAAVEQNKALASLDVEAVKVMLEKEQAITQRFSADWAAIGAHAGAVQALVTANAVPAELQIKNESGRLAADAQRLALVEQDARLNLAAGTTEAQLAMEYLKFVEGQRTHNYNAMLNALGNMFGGVMAAAQTNMGATASTSFGVTNSGTSCPCP
jgi:hypothetical protein